jgi:hypothetical protein
MRRDINRINPSRQKITAGKRQPRAAEPKFCLSLRPYRHSSNTRQSDLPHSS